MKAELIELIARVVQVLQINSKWMIWNLFLAFIPMVLSVWLFRPRSGRSRLWWLGLLVAFACVPPNADYLGAVASFLIQYIRLRPSVLLLTLPLVALGMLLQLSGRLRSWVWWLGFIVFYAFLPNAPYLLTDVIHFIDDIRTIQSVWMITLVLIPLYLLVIFAGFEAYVVSLINWGYHLHRIGKSQWILGMELITHALCAVGIYWGRFLRFNSWDFITQPDAVLTKGVEEILGKQPLVIIGVTFVVLAGLHWLMKRVTLGFLRQPDNGIAMNSRHANSNTPNVG
jgi:uncharacterized membrane protein